MRKSEMQLCKCGVYFADRPTPTTHCQWPEFPENLCSTCLRDWRLANLEYEIARIKDFGRLA